MRRLHGFLSKGLALGLAIAAATAIYLLVVSPIHGQLFETEERILEQRRLLGKYTASLTSSETETSSESGALQGLNFVLLSGESEQIKAASLQARIMDAANEAGIRPGSLAPLAARNEDGVRVVGLDIQFQSSLAGVQAVLLNLETRQPVVLIDSLQISKAPDAEHRGERNLDVRMSVLGIVGKAEEKP